MEGSSAGTASSQQSLARGFVDDMKESLLTEEAAEPLRASTMHVGRESPSGMTYSPQHRDGSGKGRPAPADPAAAAAAASSRTWATWTRTIGTTASGAA